MTSVGATARVAGATGIVGVGAVGGSMLGHFLQVGAEPAATFGGAVASAIAALVVEAPPRSPPLRRVQLGGIACLLFLLVAAPLALAGASSPMVPVLVTLGMGVAITGLSLPRPRHARPKVTFDARVPEELPSRSPFRPSVKAKVGAV